jgi:hypothetical protein
VTDLRDLPAIVILPLSTDLELSSANVTTATMAALRIGANVIEVKMDMAEMINLP